jgi:hypothetical protein
MTQRPLHETQPVHSKYIHAIQSHGQPIRNPKRNCRNDHPDGTQNSDKTQLPISSSADPIKRRGNKLNVSRTATRIVKQYTGTTINQGPNPRNRAELTSRQMPG